MTFRTPQRMELTGGCNLRDLGGHDTADGREVRRGVIYRSGVLSYLTPSDHNRSEEHTPELQSLMRISYAVFCLKKKKSYTSLIPIVPYLFFFSLFSTSFLSFFL